MSATRANSLTAVALVGVAHSPGAAPATGAPVDQLALPGEDAGRDLLLRAGAAAIYRAAGRLPRRDVPAPDPAPDETRPPCPPDAAALIESLLATRNHALLSEAFARVARSGYILPPSLLPLPADTVVRENAPTLLQLIGERGRWLGRFHPAWFWTANTLPGDGDALPPDAETIWQEGATAQRLALLARLRASDPARARDWLASVWKQEKAETRAAMLGTLATGLSPDDEPLLDAAVDDRSDRVRAVAARVLTLLPHSALAGRIRARADAALTFDGAALDANPPAAIDADWTRDGLRAQSIKQQHGPRAFWLAELLERVPPAHWVERFGKSPAELIAATVASQWRVTILHAWADATVRFQDAAWAVALWDAWLAMPSKELKRANEDRAALCRPLAPMVPPAVLEALALRMLADPSAYDGILLYEALDFLPRPWSLVVARAYLDRLRAYAGSLDPKSRLTDRDGTIDSAALALPEEAFAEALEPIALLESQNPYQTSFQRQLEAFAETIRLRERLVKVLPL